MSHSQLAGRTGPSPPGPGTQGRYGGMEGGVDRQEGLGHSHAICLRIFWKCREPQRTYSRYLLVHFSLQPRFSKAKPGCRPGARVPAQGRPSYLVPGKLKAMSSPLALPTLVLLGRVGRSADTHPLPRADTALPIAHGA